jgi:hypothetical protein
MADVYKGRVLIGSLEVDATLSERHTIAVEVTAHPVERGANVADHKRRKPAGLQLEGVVSNSPIATKEKLPAGYTQRAQSAQQYLESLADSAELVTIITETKVYENMALTELSAPRDAKTGDAYRFTASFTAIRIVENKTVMVVTAASNGKPLDKKGKQAAKKADDKLAGKGQTILKRATDALGLTTPGAGVAP